MQNYRGREEYDAALRAHCGVGGKTARGSLTIGYIVIRSLFGGFYLRFRSREERMERGIGFEQIIALIRKWKIDSGVGTSRPNEICEPASV